MTIKSSPILRKQADRSYDVLCPIGRLRALFDVLGFLYAGAGKTHELWDHRWIHDGPDGRTTLVLFRPQNGYPPRLSLLGLRIEDIDELADAGEVAT